MRSNRSVIAALVLLLLCGAGGWLVLSVEDKAPAVLRLESEDSRLGLGSQPEHQQEGGSSRSDEPDGRPSPALSLREIHPELELPQLREGDHASRPETSSGKPISQDRAIQAPTAGVAEGGQSGRRQGYRPVTECEDDPDSETAAQATVEFSVTITGRVTEPGGRGIAGAEIRTFPLAVTVKDDGAKSIAIVGAAAPTEEATIASGADGSYRASLTLSVPEGTSHLDVMIQAKARGYATGPAVQAPGLRQQAHAENVNLILKPAGSVAGRVVDEWLSPLAGTVVYALRVRGSTSRAVTDERGEFRFEDLELGQWRILPAKDSRAIAEDQLVAVVRAGDETRMPDIILHRAASARIQVLRNDGAPIYDNEEDMVRVTIRFSLRGGGVGSRSSWLNKKSSTTFRAVPIAAEAYTILVDGYNETSPKFIHLMEDRENDLGSVRLSPVE